MNIRGSMASNGVTYHIFFRLLLFKTMAFCFISCTSTKKYHLTDNRANLTLSTTIFQELAIDTTHLRSQTGLLTMEYGTPSLITRAWLCDNAVHTLDIQYYIFSSDNTGRIAGDFILRAAERGVKVRILVDDITVKPNNKQMRVLNAHENIEIKIYNPGVKFGKNIFYRIRKMLFETRRIQRRMHTKTITIDNKISIAGGRNIGDEYFDYSKKYNFRDRDILIIGKEVQSVRANFDLFWSSKLSVPLDELVKFKAKYSKRKRFMEVQAYASDPKNFSPVVRNKIREFPAYFDDKKRSGEYLVIKNAYFVADIPGKNEDRPNKKGGICTDTIVSLLLQARDSVTIQSPYLILDEEAKRLFKTIVNRGVKVKIVTNSLASTDNAVAFSGYKRDRNKILELGIEVYEFKPHPKIKYKLQNSEVQEKGKFKAVFGLHSKTMIIDDRISVIGSYNLDPRSAHLNTEGFVVIRSKDFCMKVEKYVREEFLAENSWKITKDFDPDKEASLHKRWKVFVRRLIPKKYL
jgi:cardiolipin synthase C